MPSFAELIAQSSAHAWLFVPSAILLGALHGLEPGHSKTVMAAFIVAIRGTVTQATLLGIAAAISHTLVVWVIALGGMYLWRGVNPEGFEPYFQLVSAAIIIAIALWMMWRTWREQLARSAAEHHRHGHRHNHGHDHHHGHDHGHSHDHLHEEPRGLGVAADGHQDAHELAHANDIRRRFADRNVTTWQIVLFGLTGGLIPCPAAITVLLLCLQLKQLTLGFALVVCFSIGLAITLVAVGAAAALSVRHATERWSWFGTFARRAPYASAALIILVGLYVGYTGWSGLAQTPHHTFMWSGCSISSSPFSAGSTPPCRQT
jgi:nickel/cobalt exporter